MQPEKHRIYTAYETPPTRQAVTDKSLSPQAKALASALTKHKQIPLRDLLAQLPEKYRSLHGSACLELRTYGGIHLEYVELPEPAEVA